eukprot:225320-Prorocentrum_lima.AAC.1
MQPHQDLQQRGLLKRTWRALQPQGVHPQVLAAHLPPALHEQLRLDRHEQLVYSEPGYMPPGLPTRLIRAGKVVPYVMHRMG